MSKKVDLNQLLAECKNSSSQSVQEIQAFIGRAQQSLRLHCISTLQDWPYYDPMILGAGSIGFLTQRMPLWFPIEKYLVENRIAQLAIQTLILLLVAGGVGLHYWGKRRHQKKMLAIRRELSRLSASVEMTEWENREARQEILMLLEVYQPVATAWSLKNNAIVAKKNAQLDVKQITHFLQIIVPALPALEKEIRSFSRNISFLQSGFGIGLSILGYSPINLLNDPAVSLTGTLGGILAFGLVYSVARMQGRIVTVSLSIAEWDIEELRRAIGVLHKNVFGYSLERRSPLEHKREQAVRKYKAKARHASCTAMILRRLSQLFLATVRIPAGGVQLLRSVCASLTETTRAKENLADQVYAELCEGEKPKKGSAHRKSKKMRSHLSSVSLAKTKLSTVSSTTLAATPVTDRLSNPALPVAAPPPSLLPSTPKVRTPSVSSADMTLFLQIGRANFAENKAAGLQKVLQKTEGRLQQAEEEVKQLKGQLNQSTQWSEWFRYQTTLWSHLYLQSAIRQSPHLEAECQVPLGSS